MEKIDVQNFKKYYNNNEDATIAKVGHVNAVIQELNNLAPKVAITAGANIAVVGEGTLADPFVISALGGGGYKDLGNSSAVSNIDWSEAATQELNLDDNPTLTFANAEAGDSLSLLLASDTTQRIVTWPNDVLWSRGIEPTIAKATPNGQIDPSFLSGTGFTQYGSSAGTTQGSFVLSTGKILVWSSSNSGVEYNGALLPGNTSMSGRVDLYRLNADGTIDSTWAMNNWSINQFGVVSVLELTDGRILVGGDFVNGGSQSFYGNAYLQLLSADGVRDNSFQPTFEAGNGNGITAIVKQSTGKIIVGGDFAMFNNAQQGGIVRFNADATVDTSFTATIGEMSTPQVASLAIDSSDSIFVGGNFTYVSVNGSGSYSYLVKLDASGNVSPFSYGAGFNANVTIVRVNSLDKVVVCGGFDYYNNTAIGTGITTLLPDGTLDPMFVSGAGTQGYNPTKMVLLSNDSIVILGSQVMVWNNIPVSRIAIIDTTGAIDTSIPIPAGGLNGGMYSIYGLAIQNNGNILVTGPFSSYGGSTANAIVSIKISNFIENVYTALDFKYNGNKYIGSF